MQSPPPTPEQLQRDKEDRLRQIAASVQADIDKLLREEQGEWLASTGRPMPMNIDQMVVE